MVKRATGAVGDSARRLMRAWRQGILIGGAWDRHVTTVDHISSNVARAIVLGVWVHT